MRLEKHSLKANHSVHLRECKCACAHAHAHEQSLCAHSGVHQAWAPAHHTLPHHHVCPPLCLTVHIADKEAIVLACSAPHRKHGSHSAHWQRVGRRRTFAEGGQHGSREWEGARDER